MRRTAVLVALGLTGGAGAVAAQSAGPSVVLAPIAVPAACADSVVPPAERRDPVSYRPVQRRGIAVPPLPAEPIPHGRVAVEFFVNARGSVDSVSIGGELPADFRRALRATLLTHTFWPAVYRGCAVPARMSIELSFE